MERLITYRCPITSLEVQTLSQPSDQIREGEKHYESVTCPSRYRLHFVNRKTGKLLGYEKDSG
jgi:hypothetical protein